MFYKRECNWVNGYQREYEMKLARGQPLLYSGTHELHGWKIIFKMMRFEMWTYNEEKYRKITNKHERWKVIRICVWANER